MMPVINAHGDIPEGDLLKVTTTLYGQRFYVSRRQYDSGRTLLTRYSRRGKVLGRFNRHARTFRHAEPVHRDNLVSFTA